MPAADTEITWGAYLRLSKLKSKKRKPGPQRGRYRLPDESVQRQLSLIREHAAARGLNLPDHLIFEDNGRSAWKPGEGKRPEWDRMIKMGQAGMFGGLLTWKISRFARNVRDGEDLLDLGVLLDGPDSQRIDLRTAAGKSTFRKQVEAAANESEEMSERIREAFTDMLAHGYRISGAGRTFGFEVLSEAEIDWDWEDEDPEARFAGPAAVVREEEAAVIRALARRLLDGETIVSMAADLDRRGIRTPRGRRWGSDNLGRTLRNPIYGGKLVHKGEIIGDLTNVEPILDQETFDAVQAKLGARKIGRRASGRYPLTGVLHCGNPECPRKGEGTMAGYVSTFGERRYVCAPHGGGCGKSISAEPVEARVCNEVVALTNNPDVQEKMRAADTFLDEERAKLAGLLDDLDADIAETEAKASRVPRSMTRTRAQYERNVANMHARYEEAARKLAELGEPSGRAPRVPPVTAEKWDHPQAMTPAERAEYIRRLGLRVVILPTSRPRGASRRAFEDWRVVIEEPAR